MAIAIALQSVVLLQVISKTVCQFPYPFQGGAPQMMHGMGPAMAGPSFVQPGPMHGPVPMPYPMQQKMPMVVMPYYSKANEKAQKKIKQKKSKHKKIRYDSYSSDEDDSDSVSDEFDYRVRTKAKRRQVLTPVVSYVTKDGYVVYQKKVKKEKAKDWLEMGRARDSGADVKEDEELAKKMNKLNKRTRKYHHHSKH